MTKEEALFNQEYAYIFNWKQRIEAVSGFTLPAPFTTWQDFYCQ